MAIVLDKYAIKEVADVMFYELDQNGAPSAPVLYLDTLKTSTLSQSSEVVDARGGKGNPKLLSWDTNKELTIEMEDAVFSAKSLQIMFGGDMTVTDKDQEVLKTLQYHEFNLAGDTSPKNKYLEFTINGVPYYILTTMVTAFSYTKYDSTASPTTFEVEAPVPVPNDQVNWSKKCGKTAASGGTDLTAQKIDFITFDLLDAKDSPADNVNPDIISRGMTIDIGANFNSNTYYITGDTYARNVASGQDEFLQFIIPKGKVSAEDVSLTMEADGDPATFSMTIQCLKSASGSMVRFVKYALKTASDDGSGLNKGVASVLDEYDYYESTDYTNPNAAITANSSRGDNLPKSGK